MSISVKNLTKNFGTQTAVNNISFEIHKGEIVGFLGPNGAGKSTTMKMITGYQQPDEGEITVVGIPITNAIEAKAKIGYLPEANPLYYDMYVREYLQFICGLHGIKDAKKRIEETIHLVGLSPEAHKKTGQLSKGYKQRTGLAAALVHNPEVLILDEPTSGLDPNQIVEIRNVIKNLAKDKTILLSSHIMQEVEAICDRAIIINKGKIVADDKLTNLRSTGTTQVVLVTFNKAVSIAQLQQLPSVSHVEKTSENAYKIFAENADEVKRALLQFTMDQRLDILALQSEQQSLESTFKGLTT